MDPLFPMARAQEKHLHSSARLPAGPQPGWQHPGVVHDQQVSWTKPGWEVPYMCISDGLPTNQQPAPIPIGRGVPCDACVWKRVVVRACVAIGLQSG